MSSYSLWETKPNKTTLEAGGEDIMAIDFMGIMTLDKNKPQEIIFISRTFDLKVFLHVSLYWQGASEIHNHSN